MNPKCIISDLTIVTNHWTKQRKAEERAARTRANRRAAMVRSARVTVKDAMFSVMEESIAKTSGNGRIVFPKRNLYYTVRKLIQQHTAEPLTESNFDKILRQWEADRGQLQKMYCDPRGYFIEPHTGNVVPLGTREVDAYQVPPWRYHTILFVEKKGFHGILKEAKIAERFDIGIMCAEGYSSEAGKLLLARAEQAQEMNILCFHDADPFGYNIARKLREATRAGCRMNVIDAGLKIGEALDLGLEPEVFYRDRALPQGLELDELEREYFEGRYTGDFKQSRPVYECRRAELNDLASDPDRFNAWVVGKLEKHGCCRKLVPPQGIVQVYANEMRDHLLGNEIREQLKTLLKVDAITNEVTAKLREMVPIQDMHASLTAWAQNPTPKPWDEALAAMISDCVRSLNGKIREHAGRCQKLTQTPTTNC